MSCKKKTTYLLYLVLVWGTLFSDELTVDPPPLWNPLPPPCPVLCPIDEEVVVDLSNPIYEDGVLSTESGGVLTALDLRIQAQKITYYQNEERKSVTCEGNLLVDYKQWTLVGDYFFYDFTQGQGFLLNGRTAAPPWTIGGERLSLTDQGCIIVSNAFMTTSEGGSKDVLLKASCITLFPDGILQANRIQIEVNRLPLFWLPALKINLNTIARTPFAIKYGWRGFAGSYVSLLYRILSWNELEVTARLDGFFNKGVGAGLETSYCSPYRPTQFYTRNYYAHDIPLDDPQRKDRYRFQGTYSDLFCGAIVNGMYDFVSDGEMAADYQTKDFDLKTAGRTQIECRKKTVSWLANLCTRVRVNHFQSVNQELPTLHFNLHPFEIPHTGIICQNTFRGSYLDYVFSNATLDAPSNFSSGRLAVIPLIYRPCYLNPLIVTPEVGCIAIAYSNSPSGRPVGQALGRCALKLETALLRSIGHWKHVVEPYIHYQYLTHPRIKTDQHFIFSLNDGWDYLNQLRFGCRSSFFNRSPSSILRPLWIDMWTNAFFATPTIRRVIPKGYLNLEWQPHPLIYSALESGWNFEHHQLDFCKMRLDWTINTHLAFGIEYRHRGSFDWRKGDFYNFILESVRSEQDLLHSPLSDRRNTLLFRAFARLDPDWAVEFDLRHGWHRKEQSSYLEYQVALTKVLYQHWRLTINYEKREADHRFSFSLLLDPGPP